jgi:Zn-dependent protease/CBS domain-containing protein
MTSAARGRPGEAPAPPRAARSGLGGAIRIFSVGGIDVAVHLSWLVIFGLVTWSLATAYFPAALPDAGEAQHWILGVVASLLLFASVLLHELAHSFVAKARGLDVRSITLFIFGGVSNLAGEAKKPGTEFQIAIVGPITSFAIAALAFGVAVATEGVPMVAAVATYLAIINALLGGFNLVPGFPLDGGRVLRSIVWSATGNLRRATEVAAGAGQVVAWLLMLWGFWRIFGGDIFGGLWTAAIGWFLQNAAQASLQQTVMETHLRRLRVGDVVRVDPTAADPSTSVAELIERFLLPGARRAVPIVDVGRLGGIVTLSDIRDVPAEQRATTPVSAIMSGPEGLVTVTPQTPLRSALEALVEGEYEQVPVVEDGRLVGVLTRADVMRVLQIREALDLDGRER